MSLKIKFHESTNQILWVYKSNFSLPLWANNSMVHKSWESTLRFYVLYIHPWEKEQEQEHVFQCDPWAGPCSVLCHLCRYCQYHPGGWRWSFTLYTVHCTLYTINCTLYTMHCTLYTINCTLYTMYCTLYTINCKLCTVLSTLHSTADCKFHTAHQSYSVPALPITVAINCTDLQWSSLHCTLHSTLYTLHFFYLTHKKIGFNTVNVCNSCY